ncbi:hypothetical protein CTAYLR_003569 [Chrysophaeum taylorii]|uniref:Ion transport domain-containing protein n=1 Tax=Chrysophaeum taylorii TaxID=2483200 RepID=A0AAD7XM47_9STRA|nr:hypothetical protein CTAYLR_003569 [Chrysophaeum taylorii]
MLTASSHKNSFEAFVVAPQIVNKKRHSNAETWTRARRAIKLRQSVKMLESKMPTAIQRSVGFPAQSGVCVKVFSPNSQRRFVWDMYMLFCTMFVMVATPFELAFVGDSGRCFGPVTGMFVANTFINVSFSIDMLLQLNTSFFDPMRGEWVMDHWQIILRYLKTWFLVDVMSVMPVECLGGQSATLRYAKLVRSTRFFKLLKVAKSPRILQAASRHLDISSKLQTISKYLAALLFTVHWSACMLRVLTWVACEGDNGKYSNQGRVDDNDDGSNPFRGCPNTVLTTSYNWGDGIWAVYATAALWANMALNGEATAKLHSEAVLGIAIMLIGFLILGFLLGELTNTLSNLDPVGNKFKMVKDNLTEFMSRYEFSKELKLKLREYISLSEHVFRGAHYRELLSSLSPQFRLICATQVYGYSVVCVPFMRYAVQAAHAVRVGSIVYVKPRLSPEQPPKPRPRDGQVSVADHKFSRPAASRRAEIVEVTDYLVYTVVYSDTGEYEHEVHHTDLDIELSFTDARVQNQIFRISYERDSIVAQMAQHFHSQLSMPRDHVIKRNISLNDAMYLIDSGSVVIVGGSSVKRYRSQLKGRDQFFGDDVTMLFVGDRKKRLVHYSVKTLRVTHFKVISGDDLIRIIGDSPCYPHHKAHIRRYGIWLLVKSAMIQRFRDNQDVARAEIGASLSSSFTHHPRRMLKHQHSAPARSALGGSLRPLIIQHSRSVLNAAEDDDRENYGTRELALRSPPPPDELYAFLAKWFVSRVTASADEKIDDQVILGCCQQLYTAIKDATAPLRSHRTTRQCSMASS